jgi:hypothetical protein
MSTFNSFTPAATEAATDRTIVYCYDLATAPKGKLQLLSLGGIISHGEINDPIKARDLGVWGWALCPVRDRAEEIRLGLGAHKAPPSRWDHTHTVAQASQGTTACELHTSDSSAVTSPGVPLPPGLPTKG